MEIKLTDKQNKLLSGILQTSAELQKQIELVTARQNELVDLILEFNSVEISNVTELNLSDGILTIKLKE